MNLSQLKIGKRAKVLSYTLPKEISDRLERLGVIKGVEIKLVRVAPLGDPFEIKVRNFNLAIRKSVADKISVQEIE